MKNNKIILCLFLCILLAVQCVLTACQAPKEPSMNLPTENNTTSEPEVQTKEEEISTFTETTNIIPDATPSDSEEIDTTSDATPSDSEEVDTASDTTPSDSEEVDTDPEGVTNPFTPPDGMTLLGEVAAEPPSLVVNEMNGNNDSIGSSSSPDEEADILPQWKKPELAGSEATLTHFGFEAKGTYRSSYRTPYYNETVDIYDGVTESGAKYSFSLSSNTGKLKTFLYPFTPDTLVDGYRPAVLPDIDKPALTKEECTQIAKDLLYNGMEAVGTYKGYVSYMKTNSVVDGYYEFRFTRWIGDVKTAEFVLIQVTSRGRILYVYSDQFKAFDHVDSLDYDEKEVTAAFEYKLANLYKSDLQDKSLYYKSDAPVLTRLSDGKIYLKYALDVAIYTKDGKPFAHDLTNLLVCIG